MVACGQVWIRLGLLCRPSGGLLQSSGRLHVQPIYCVRMYVGSSNTT